MTINTGTLNHPITTPLGYEKYDDHHHPQTESSEHSEVIPAHVVYSTTPSQWRLPPTEDLLQYQHAASAPTTSAVAAPPSEDDDKEDGRNTTRKTIPPIAGRIMSFLKRRKDDERNNNKNPASSTTKHHHKRKRNHHHHNHNHNNNIHNDKNTIMNALEAQQERERVVEKMEETYTMIGYTVACLAIITALIAISMYTNNSIIKAAFLFPLITAPHAVSQRQKISKASKSCVTGRLWPSTTLFEDFQRLQQRLHRFQQQNDILQNQYNYLENQLHDLEAADRELAAILQEQGRTKQHVQQLVKENSEITRKIIQLEESRNLLHIVRVAASRRRKPSTDHTDSNSNNSNAGGNQIPIQLTEGEINEVIQCLKIMSSPRKLDEYKIRKALKHHHHHNHHRNRHMHNDDKKNNGRRSSSESTTTSSSSSCSTSTSSRSSSPPCGGGTRNYHYSMVEGGGGGGMIVGGVYHPLEGALSIEDMSEYEPFTFPRTPSIEK